MEGEELQVIEDGDMEDWLKVTAALLFIDHININLYEMKTCFFINVFLYCASVLWVQVCNSCGQVGYVPERYVQFLCLPAEDGAQLDSSFSSTSSTGYKEKAASRGQ